VRVRNGKPYNAGKGKKKCFNSFEGVKSGPSVFRGVDDMELKFLELTGKLERHGDRKGIFVTPNKNIAQRYGSNIIEIDASKFNVQPVPGRSKMFLIKQDIWPGDIKKITRAEQKSYGGLRTVVAVDRRKKGNNYDPFNELSSLAEAQKELDKEGLEVFYTPGQEKKMINSFRRRGIKVPPETKLPDLISQYNTGEFDVMEELENRKYLPKWSPK